MSAVTDLPNLFKNKTGAVHLSLRVIPLFLVHHLCKQFSLLGPRSEEDTWRLCRPLLCWYLSREERFVLEASGLDCGEVSLVGFTEKATQSCTEPTALMNTIKVVVPSLIHEIRMELKIKETTWEQVSQMPPSHLLSMSPQLCFLM